jgi:DNA-binding SARP family transcriptional activator/tetratricopeptide (TPR) repeat protein
MDLRTWSCSVLTASGGAGQRSAGHPPGHLHHRDAELLAVALDQALYGRTDESTALTAYRFHRDPLRDIFELTCALASYPPASESVELQSSYRRGLARTSLGRVCAGSCRTPGAVRQHEGVRCELRMLGGFGAAVDGAAIASAAWRHRRALQLVKILALAAGHRLVAEQVVDLMWPDLSAQAGGANLRKAAHLARHVLGVPDAVVLAGGAVALLPHGDVWTDAQEFERAAAAALRSGDRGLLATAIGLYAGDLLPDDRYEDWAAAPRERLRARYLAALRRAGEWERLVEEEPTDEEAHRALIRGWLDRGNHHAAMRQFTRLRDVLARELGVRPSTETLALWSAIEAAAPPPAAGPLAGRDGELELAASRWMRARAGRGSVLLISGEAGIGKTRFCDELVGIARADGAAVMRGSARHEEASSPFGVVLRVVDDALAGRPELASLLSPEVRRWAPGFARAAVAGLSWQEGAAPGIERQRLFSSVARLVSTAAEPAGLLLVVEDLHDADDGSLQLLTHLGQSVTRDPVMVVLTHRTETASPALVRLRSVLLADRRTVDLRLDPLGRDGVASLVAQVAERVPDAAVEQIWRLAEGNPFYTEELAAAFAAGGRIRVPDRVYEVIWARLDRLDSGVRHALRQMAVAGDTFTADELTAVLGGDEAAAFDCLDQALRIGVLDERGPAYQFRHTLTRRALERSLPWHRRRQIHADTAARLGRTGTGPARVAYHLLRAGQELAAVPWLQRAAMEAAALGAYSDGLRLATDAVSRAGPADRAGLLALRADMLYATGDPTAGAAYDAALATAPAGARPRLWTMKARVLLGAGALDEAARALDFAEPAGVEDRIAKLVVTGLVAWAGGDSEAAERAARQARELALTHGHTPGLGEATELLGLVAHSRGEWRDRVRYELTDTLKRPEEVAGAVFDAHLCLAEYLLYGQQPYDQVIDFASDLRATAVRAGAGRGEAFATCVLGEAELLSGRLDEAVDHLARAAALHEAVDAPGGQALSLQRLGEAALAAGDAVRAVALLDDAERVAQGSSLERHLLGKVYGTRVRAAADPALAMSVVEHGEARMAGHPVCQPCSIGFYVAASIAASRAGDLVAAKDYLATADRVSARWPGGSWHAAVTECRAELARAGSRPDDAARLYDQAADGFDRAGQPLDAQRCRAAVA